MNLTYIILIALFDRLTDSSQSLKLLSLDEDWMHRFMVFVAHKCLQHLVLLQTFQTNNFHLGFSNTSQKVSAKK